jgi:predicted dehydrogenase
MIAAARQAGVQLGIAYRCQFEPHHLECVRLAREEVFGKVREVEAGFGFRMRDAEQWRIDRELSGGGPLMDLGIYALQTARMLAGREPVEVSAVQSNADPEMFKDVESDITVTLTFADGLVARCSSSYTAPMNSFTARAERGSFGMQPAYSYGGNRGWRSDGAPLSFPEINQFVAEMDDFADCILTGRQTRVPGEEGLRDLRIMMAAYESAQSGRPVRLGNG